MLGLELAGLTLGVKNEGWWEGGAMGSGGMSVSEQPSMSMSHRQRVGLPSGTGEPARGAGRSGVDGWMGWVDGGLLEGVLGLGGVLLGTTLPSQYFCARQACVRVRPVRTSGMSKYKKTHSHTWPTTRPCASISPSNPSLSCAPRSEWSLKPFFRSRLSDSTTSPENMAMP